MNKIIAVSFLLIYSLAAPSKKENSSYLSIESIQNAALSFYSNSHLFGSKSLPNLQGNCSYSPASIRLEGYRIQDQPEGELITNDPSQGQSVTPSKIAKHIKQDFPHLKNPLRQPTLLIVIDDFDTNIDLNRIAGSNGITHGQIIEGQTTKTIDELHDNSNVSVYKVHLPQDEKSTLSPFGRISSSLSIANQIRTILNSTNGNYTGYVVNMSFVLLSCEVIKDYEKWLNTGNNKRLNFLDYAKEIKKRSLISQPIKEVVEALLSIDQIQEKIEKDPLEALSEAKTGTPVKYVAAAGNYGLPYPLFPAAWPKFLGVGATDAQKQNPYGKLMGNSRKIYWSNFGETKEFGQWLAQDVSTTNTSSKTVYYRGTSFSTPIVSLIIALDLNRGYDACGFEDLAKSFPNSMSNNFLGSRPSYKYCFK